jgi:uncharacterized protein (TIGR03435 family)
MRRVALVLLAAGAVFAQTAAFEVATIKPTPSDWLHGRYMMMQTTHQFVAKNFTVKMLIAGAYNLTKDAVSGGPAWTDDDHYDILASTPGEARPARDAQMAMLRTLIGERFKLTFHREPKELAVYALTIAKNGSKLKAGTTPVDTSQDLVGVVFPDHIRLPGHNASTGQLASFLQRVVLDRPVVDETGLEGRYDFELEWTQDSNQFGGEVPKPPQEADKPDIFAALQEELGLRLRASRGTVQTLVIDKVERPTAN